jgi:serine/threonine-protein phosphatase 2B catalytic subunit
VKSNEGICDPLFKLNNVRGCSYFYGIEAIHKFFKNTKYISLIRGHEAELEGYKMHKWKGEVTFPPVITLFSAPNYCDVYNNQGAIIKFAVIILQEWLAKYSAI